MFARQPIPYGTVLGEYLGELVPDFQSLPRGDRYVLLLDAVDAVDAVCTARRFGNITRFLNHHCQPNVTVETGMYGKRLVELFKADTDIAAGDQVFISYGRAYFEGMGISCQCDDQPAAHLPPRHGGGSDTEDDTDSDSDTEDEIQVAVKAAPKAAPKAAAKQAIGKKVAAAKQAVGKKVAAAKQTVGKKVAAAKHNPARPMGKKSAKGQYNPKRPMGKKSAKGRHNPAPHNPAPRNPAPRRLTRAAGVWKRK